MKNLFNSIDKVYVINLKKDSARRVHVDKQFKKKQITYEFVDAVSHNDEEVKKIYKENNVMSFPPCFRCKKEICDHENNYLAPKQIANFLSFNKVFKLIQKDKIKTAFIFEDDFKFKFFSNLSFKHLEVFIEKNKLLQSNEPLLFRVGSHTRVNKKYYFKLFLLNRSTFLKNNINMANPCFISNYEFANEFLNNFKQIYTTSDNFIHRFLCKKSNVTDFSIYPFPIKQLSYGNKKNFFESSINPTSDFSEGFVYKNKVSSLFEYKKLLEQWLEN